MTTPVLRDRGSAAPATYRLRVSGHLDPHWSSWFDDLAIVWDEDGTTELTGPVSDQAQLHGVLNKVRNLDLTLLSVVRVESD